ncbi:MAG: hypothetical protein VCB78_13730 [Myxococcota bacterium]
MRIRGLGTSFALVAAIALAACGPAEQAKDIASKEASALEDAASTGAAARAAEAAAAWADDAKQAIDSKGVAQAAKDVADEAKQRVSDSAGKFEAAYDEARGEGKSPLEAAGDAYNAVDRNED